MSPTTRSTPTGFDPYEVFGGTESCRAWEGAPLGWSTWIHNNASCIDEFIFNRREDDTHVQSTRHGVITWKPHTASAIRIDGDDFATVLAMAKQIHEWCKAQPKEDWL